MIKKLINVNNDLTKKIENLKKKGKKIVLCHGSFDLVHPGHIEHLSEAKMLGDILIVSITADKFIKKSINNPFFNQDERHNFLGKIKLIDYVVITNDETAIPAIKAFKPDYYCKGVEYLKKDKIGNLKKEKSALSKINGKIKFLGKNVQSSSKFIYKAFYQFEDKSIKKNLLKIKNSEVEKIVKKIKDIKVLIIGETIIDKYTYVETQGVSPKSNTLSCITQEEQVMPGGALATYKFLKSICKNVKLISLVNENLITKNSYKKIFQNIKGIIKTKDFGGIIKNRIVERDDQKIKKLLTINNIDNKKLSKTDEKKLFNNISKTINKYDLVIVQDFGHNLFSDKIIDLIERKSKKMSLNVQTNSLNYGFNVIGQKFKKTDFYSLDERELELFSKKKIIEHEKELNKLNKHLQAKKGFLTCGGKFSLVIEKGKTFKVPTLNRNAIDPMGAGDIFQGLASVLSCVTNNNFLVLFLSQIAGAHAVNILGNSDYPKISEILKTFYFYKSK